MMRRLHQSQMLCLMARPADFWLRCVLAYWILGGMQLVAIGASNVVRRMGTRAPGMRGVALVAAEAQRILPGGRGPCFSPKVHDAGRLPALRFGMRATRAMTCFALQSAMPERAARIARLRMLSAEQRQDLRIVVTTEAGVRTRGTISGRWRRGGCGSAGDT